MKKRRNKGDAEVTEGDKKYLLIDLENNLRSKKIDSVAIFKSLNLINNYYLMILKSKVFLSCHFDNLTT